MKTLRKSGAILLAAVLLCVGIPLMPLAADPVAAVEVKSNKEFTFQAGRSQDIRIVVTNSSGQDLEEVSVTPELASKNDVWPFQEEQSAKKIGLKAGEKKEVNFAFTQKDEMPTGTSRIRFRIRSGGNETESETIYINTTAKTQEIPAGTAANETRQAAEAAKGGESMAETGVSNAEASYVGAGGGGGGNTSVPRVIVTGFTTNPGEVKAGTDFTLTIHLRNTSKTMRVNNMLFDLNAPAEGSEQATSSPAFLPSSGSSSIYLEGIPAGGTADISIAMNAKADLVQKPYNIELSMKYEDANAAQIQATSNLSIPVKQEARFEFSQFEISPESIAVGEEANVMTTLYNLGKIKLYNVKATFEGAAIEKSEIFVGNVEPGGKGSIDSMLKGKTETEGPAKITMTVSYEDEAGNVSTVTKEFQLEVTQESQEDMAAGMEVPAEQPKSPAKLIIGGVGVLAAVIAAVVLIRRRKKKLKANEEEGLLDEVDRSSEDKQ